jgi:cytochrome c-type biogenesis protein CcmH
MHSPWLFWVLAAAMVIATLGVLLSALLRPRAGVAGPGAETASVALYRDQRRQLDADLAAGNVTADEHAAQLTELSTRLGHEISAPDAAPVPMPRAPWVAALLLTAAVPLLAAGLYFGLGNPAAIVASGVRPAPSNISQDQIVAMVESLAAKMKEHPGDARGWSLLGRSYAALGRFDDAAHAYAQAAEHAPNDANALIDWAGVLAMSQGQSLQGKPTELINKALAIDPANHKALALAGSAAADRRDFPAALKYWRTLAAALPPDSEEGKDVAGAIADVERAQAGGAPASAPGAGAPTAATPGAAAAAGGAAGAAIAPSSAAIASAKATLRGRVELAPSLAARAHPGDTVFIFARAVNGPRMPLAILRATVSDLPKDFTLDDSLGMAPGMTLSAFPQVMVEARISGSGNAVPASGDLAGQTGPVASNSANIRVLIDHVIP